MSAMLLGRTTGGNHRAGRRHRAKMLKRIPLLAAVAALIPVAGSASPAGASRSVPTATAGGPVVATAVPEQAYSPPADGSVTTPHAAGPMRSGPLLRGPGVRPGERPPGADPVMKTPTTSGAMATAVYFVQALDWSIATNDPYLVRQLGLPSCRACSAYAARFAALRKAHAKYVGGRWTVKSVALVHGPSGIRSDYVARVVSDVARASLIVDGAPVQRFRARKDVATYVFVSWVGRRWRVVAQTA